MTSPLQLILFTGLQAAGKSTYYKENFYRTHVRINLDMLRTRHRESIIFKACLEGKAHIVIDNTNVTATERSVYITLAKAAKYVVHSYYFQTSVDQCLRYNELRSEEERVPRAAILSTSQRMEKPTIAEGFDALYLVRLDEYRKCITELMEARTEVSQ